MAVLRCFLAHAATTSFKIGASLFGLTKIARNLAFMALCPRVSSAGDVGIRQSETNGAIEAQAAASMHRLALQTDNVRFESATTGANAKGHAVRSVD